MEVFSPKYHPCLQQQQQQIPQGSHIYIYVLA